MKEEAFTFCFSAIVNKQIQKFIFNTRTKNTVVDSEFKCFLIQYSFFSSIIEFTQLKNINVIPGGF